MHPEELIYLHALRSLPSFGDKSLRKLLDVFVSAKSAWDATHIPSTLLLSPKTKESFLDRHNYIPNPEKHYEILTSQGIEIITKNDTRYPKLLLEIPDYPYLLYVRGNFDWNSLNQKSAIAIVGSRKFTSYGEQVALRLAYDLTQAGYIVVSGLAFGIDRKAHEGALDAEGSTVAVLGGGIDDAGIAPRSNFSLAKNILKNGALISEHPPGVEMLPAYFAIRNRIIAGMCQGTLVIEAAEGSGSLITASLALDYNREVFAIPGSIFSPTSTGTHALIRAGAKLVTHAKDIIEEIHPGSYQENIPLQDPVKKIDLTPLEEKVYKILTHEPEHLNILARHTGLSINEIQSTLTLLEIKGLARNIGAMQYIRTHS
jgi:DNA processing protein